jgi:hypothetical protein
MVKALGLTKKISSADLLRTYSPNFVAEESHLETLERLHKRVTLEAELNARGVSFPPCVVPLNLNRGQNRPPQPPTSSVGNGVDQPGNP